MSKDYLFHRSFSIFEIVKHKSEILKADLSALDYAMLNDNYPLGFLLCKNYTSKAQGQLISEKVKNLLNLKENGLFHLKVTNAPHNRKLLGRDF